MEKRKRWQFFLIVGVLALTIYNILPTVFYYTQPLKAPIEEKKAQEISHTIAKRVNDLEKEATKWVSSYCDLLHIKSFTLHFDPQSPEEITVDFKKAEQAELFRRHFQRAGSAIPFSAAQLQVSSIKESPKSVLIQRKIPVHFDEKNLSSYFTFSKKKTPSGEISPFYKQIVFDRALQIALAVGGESSPSVLAKGLIENPRSSNKQQQAYSLASDIVSFTQVFGEDSSITKRYFNSFFLDNSKKASVQNLLSALNQVRDELKQEKISLKETLTSEEKQDLLVKGQREKKIALLEKKQELLTKAYSLVKAHSKEMSSTPSWTKGSIKTLLDSSFASVQTLVVGKNSPFIDKILINWNTDQISLVLHKDFLEEKIRLASLRGKGFEKEQREKLLINEIARIGRKTNETLLPSGQEFSIELNQLTNSQSFLALDLSLIAKAEAKNLKAFIEKAWSPKHPELSSSSFPIWDEESYKNEPIQNRSFGLLIYSPTEDPSIEKDLPSESLYVVAKGVDKILQKYQEEPEAEEAKLFLQDFYDLRDLLVKKGFVGYPGSSPSLPESFQKDYLFEKGDPYLSILAATREAFSVHGTKKFALLEFTDLEQRILTMNRIETAIHEDLLKKRDDYNAAQVSMNPQQKWSFPKPKENPLWNNLLLSFHKYFRGDERKILHWGIDLSGGKTVEIELRDQHNRQVVGEEEIKQGINELYSRVNKMGVSDVNIRREGSHIVLDFPGSQGLSAQELIKASSMFFHVVNEKFSPTNPELGPIANQFLQEVWNEAVVTNRKDSESIHAIAYRTLYGEGSIDNPQPLSESAKTLYDHGLRLVAPHDQTMNSSFNDSISRVALFRDAEEMRAQGYGHPLLFIFHNYALDGTSLENIRAGYNPSQGNFLSFEVRGSYTTKEGLRCDPREDLFSWSSPFSKEKIAGSPLETYTQGSGFRLAAILNDRVISAPTLNVPLRDNAMITGKFSQREVNQLAADLKAGSLTFTPKILSEKNVSPELGKAERTKGVIATILALLLVMAAMIGYYRFAGLIASIAVVFNLLILWATLQNLHATLSLAGIAGIILTMGMAVDANVLIFERIKEEFALSGRLSSAIQTGYKKAFNAIIDSNLTTLIAGFILLNFDSGPIKAFAITLIIGIASSLFTALFLTRYFFFRWIKNPKNTRLQMSDWIRAKKFNFLKWTKVAFITSLMIIAVGGFLLNKQRFSIFGMDFTGGYSLQVEVVAKEGKDVRKMVENALTSAGISPQNFQVRQLNTPNNLQILLGLGINQQGAPFYEMPLEIEKSDLTYSYESNPRITWVVDALQKGGLSIEKRALDQLDKKWTSISGQMSDTMRNHALVGMGLALFCILLYITFRFEFKYAISTLLCTLHDVLITVGAIAILYFIGLPVPIDLHTIAAIMTIIGYSLNDTIIVFDRIREDSHLSKKMGFSQVINQALNVTLSRTTITSATTLIVLLALVALGGTTIFNFALVMTIGVVLGTLSSLFIASPLLLFFHKREAKKEEKSLSHSPKS